MIMRLVLVCKWRLDMIFCTDWFYCLLSFSLYREFTLEKAGLSVIYLFVFSSQSKYRKSNVKLNRKQKEEMNFQSVEFARSDKRPWLRPLHRPGPGPGSMEVTSVRSTVNRGSGTFPPLLFSSAATSVSHYVMECSLKALVLHKRGADLAHANACYTMQALYGMAPCVKRTPPSSES